ncbi:MAG: mercuric transporter MerT family protein [Thermodesulfobacteriota bacterium]
MTDLSRKHADGVAKWGLAGAVAAAVGASVCCLGPLLLLALGVGGAWIGNLTAMEKYRPIWTAATLVFLGLAFARVYRKPKGDA